MSVRWNAEGYEPEPPIQDYWPDEETPGYEAEYISQPIFYHDVPPRIRPRAAAPEPPPVLLLLPPIRAQSVLQFPVRNRPMQLALVPDLPLCIDVGDEAIDRPLMLMRWVYDGEALCDFTDGDEAQREFTSCLREYLPYVRRIVRRLGAMERAVCKERGLAQLRLFGADEDED